MIPARILGTGSILPGRAVSNDDLAAILPGRTAAEIDARTGIRSRHWAPEGISLCSLGADVLRLALEDAGTEPTDLRRVIFVSTCGGDMLLPANANQVAYELGIDGTADAFDLNNACLGFITAMDIAARSVATGLGPIGITVVEQFSDMGRPEESRELMVAGDAAVAAVVGQARPGEGVLALYLGNKGSLGATVRQPHPRRTKALETVRFTASHREMAKMALDLIQQSTDEVLRQSGLRLDDIAWILPHQPNGPMFDAIVRALGAPAHKLVPMVAEVGTIGAASMPLTLDRLRRSGKVAPGDRILLVGVGSGVSYGAMIYQTAPG